MAHLTRGAGVLPYAYEPTTGELVILLYRKTKGKKVGFWVDFGGALEDKDTSIQCAVLRECAAREFSEETWGLFYVSEEDRTPEHVTSIDVWDFGTPSIQFSTRQVQAAIETGRGVLHIPLISGVYDCFVVPVPFFPLSLLNVPMAAQFKACDWVSFDQWTNLSQQALLYPRISTPEVNAAVAALPKTRS